MGYNKIVNLITAGTLSFIIISFVLIMIILMYHNLR